MPGVTDTDENLRGIARHLSALPGPPRVERLPFNRAAGGKYAACGLEWRPAFDETATPNAGLKWFQEFHLQVSAETG